MKRSYTLLASVIMIFLIIATTDTAIADGNPTSFENHGFHTTNKFTNVNGSVEVTDLGIVISIDISPNTNALRAINESKSRNFTRPSGMNHFNGDLMDPTALANSMNITLYALAEFEDQGTVGYDENDQIISMYYLNSSTLNPVEYNGSTYSITSMDGVFSMTINENSTSGKALGWKWTVDIQYPFESNTSSIAMLHEISTLHNDIRNKREHMGGHPAGSPVETPQYERVQNRSMVSKGKGTPMFFSWIGNATVDGVNQSVAVTRGEVFAISVLQGDVISYDPAIGVTYATVNDIDGLLSTTSDTSVNSVFFPALTAGIGIIGLVIFSKNRR